MKDTRDLVMRLVHLERALTLLRSHATSREQCDRTQNLITETEAFIASLREHLPAPVPIAPPDVHEQTGRSGLGMIAVVMLMAIVGAVATQCVYVEVDPLYQALEVKT